MIRDPNFKAAHLKSPAPVPDPDHHHHHHHRRPDVKRNVCVKFLCHDLSFGEWRLWEKEWGWAICTHQWLRPPDKESRCQEPEKKTKMQLHPRTFVLRHHVVSLFAPTIDALGCLVT